MKILRLDMRTGNSSYEDADETYPMLGGRGLIAALLLKEIDPACDPLGDDNKLVICNGLMAGTLAATSGRLSLGGKSPLTGTINRNVSFYISPVPYHRKGTLLLPFSALPYRVAASQYIHGLHRSVPA